MKWPKICLCLTGETLAEDLALLEKYRKYIDMVELRADFLTKDEQLDIRDFPRMAKIPCILTIRRAIDGGCYEEGEARRTTLFARALAYADSDPAKNFAYIDLEEDYDVPSLQDAALAFGTRIIRSYHCMNGTDPDILDHMKRMRKTAFEIPKIALQPRNLDDVTDIFHQAKEITSFDHILCAMGPVGLPTRILANKLNSYLTYVTPIEKQNKLEFLGHLDPISINEIYNFRAVDDNTSLFGITGWPLRETSNPVIHNSWYRLYGMNALYIPVRAQSVEEASRFAQEVGMEGLGIDSPFKEEVMHTLPQVSATAGEVGACNTIIRCGASWCGFNTEPYAFKRALLDFVGGKTLFRRKVAIIGTGGTALAVASIVRQLHGKACIFNRTVSKARQIAEFYNFRYAQLGPESIDLLEDYSDIIVQTTTVGTDGESNPIDYYEFQGHENVFELIYYPAKTPLMRIAEKAGCRVQNGRMMLEYQAEKQFALFTGLDINSEK
jgi:3-dehydroquinate dehydratase/shikimate dehydrogenase